VINGWLWPLIFGREVVRCFWVSALMAIDPVTITVLTSTLASDAARKLFRKIAASRIADVDSLKKDVPEAQEQLEALKKADLIGLGDSGKNFYVTARGLKVARDLEQIPGI
jgi:predicted MarR family transcription regulator